VQAQSFCYTVDNRQVPPSQIANFKAKIKSIRNQFKKQASTYKESICWDLKNGGSNKPSDKWENCISVCSADSVRY